MLSTIRKCLQRIRACIFALRIFDEEKMWPILNNPQEEGRRAKKTQENCQCLGVSFWKDVAGDVAGPCIILGKH
jgi:hypothetical protein